VKFLTPSRCQPDLFYLSPLFLLSPRLSLLQSNVVTFRMCNCLFLLTIEPLFQHPLARLHPLCLVLVSKTTLVQLLEPTREIVLTLRYSLLSNLFFFSSFLGLLELSRHCTTSLAYHNLQNSTKCRTWLTIYGSLLLQMGHLPCHPRLWAITIS
jgi:hypothetical protein